MSKTSKASGASQLLLPFPLSLLLPPLEGGTLGSVSVAARCAADSSAAAGSSPVAVGAIGAGGAGAAGIATGLAALALWALGRPGWRARAVDAAGGLGKVLPGADLRFYGRSVLGRAETPATTATSSVV